MALECGHPDGCYDVIFDSCRWCHQLASLQTKLDEAEAGRQALQEQIGKTAIVLAPGEHDLTLKEPIGMLVVYGGSVNFRGLDALCVGAGSQIGEHVESHGSRLVLNSRVSDFVSNVKADGGSDDATTKEAVREGGAGEADKA